jgi:hypothetical protein
MIEKRVVGSFVVLSLAIILTALILWGIFSLGEKNVSLSPNDHHLIGYYKFDGDISDSSGNGNDLIFLKGSNDGLFYESDSDRGMVAKFDGTYLFEFPGVDSIGDEFTIAGWFAPDDVGNSYNIYVGAMSGENWGMSLGVSGSDIFNTEDMQHSNAFRIRLENEDEMKNLISGHKYGDQLNYGDWNYLVVSWDGETQKLFIGNSQNKQEDVYGGNLVELSEIYVGSINPSGRLMKGKMDDLRIYNYALSDAEIKYLFGNYGSVDIDAGDSNEFVLKKGLNIQNPYIREITIGSEIYAMHYHPTSGNLIVSNTNQYENDQFYRYKDKITGTLSESRIDFSTSFEKGDVFGYNLIYQPDYSSGEGYDVSQGHQEGPIKIEILEKNAQYVVVKVSEDEGIVPECSSNEDCAFGKICEERKCVDRDKREELSFSFNDVKVAYSFPSPTRGRVNVWTDDNKVHIFNPNEEIWFIEDLSSVTDVLPNNFEIDAGYWSPISRDGECEQYGCVYVWGDENVYRYEISSQTWEDYTDSKMDVLDISENFEPVFGYYDSDEEKVVLVDGDQKVYLLNSSDSLEMNLSDLNCLDFDYYNVSLKGFDFDFSEDIDGNVWDGSNFLSDSEDCEGRCPGGIFESPNDCVTQNSQSYCGDGTCDIDEDCETCQVDCGICSECGDGIISGNELCDGENLDGKSCVSLGYDGGDLACSENCLSFDKSNCVRETECDFDSDCEEGEVCNLDGICVESQEDEKSYWWVFIILIALIIIVIMVIIIIVVLSGKKNNSSNEKLIKKRESPLPNNSQK